MLKVKTFTFKDIQEKKQLIFSISTPDSEVKSALRKL